MKKLGIFVMGLMVIVVMAGCSTTTVRTFDKDTGKMVSETVTSTDIAGTIVESTKGKSVLMWKSGWAGYISVSPGTQDDPSPHGKMFAGKVDEGYIGILKDQSPIDYYGLANVISAMSKSLGVSATGIGSISEKPTTPVTK